MLFIFNTYVSTTRSWVQIFNSVITDVKTNGSIPATAHFVHFLNGDFQLV